MEGAKKINLHNPDSLQNSWSQALLLFSIAAAGVASIYLPLPYENKQALVISMTASLIGVVLYFKVKFLHQHSLSELLIFTFFALAIFVAIFSAREYGFYLLFLNYLLSIPVAIIHIYKRFFLILVVQSAALMGYWLFYSDILSEGAHLVIILNIIALWTLNHFIWFYVEDSYRITIENQLTKNKIQQMKDFEIKRSDFLHIAAHQLKNPLGITRFILLGFQKDKVLSKQKKKQLTQASFQIETALAFLEDTTRILNMEGASTNITEEDVEIEILVKEIVTELEQLAKEKNLHIIKHIGGIIPSVISDRMYLKIAISNIIDNAIKYSMQNSRIVINITEEKKYINISVQDFGIGITRADQQRIYEKFFRGETARELSPKGTGLGLYLVRTIINKINAKISFESTLNKGSTFTISVPINQ